MIRPTMLFPESLALPVGFPFRSGSRRSALLSGVATAVLLGLRAIAAADRGRRGVGRLDGRHAPRTNVAAGRDTGDAVNVAQLQGAVDAAPLQYATAGAPTTANPGVASNGVTLVGAGAGAVSLHNLAVGKLAANSTMPSTGRSFTRAAPASPRRSAAGPPTTRRPAR